jgi:hypothetical protein
MYVEFVATELLGETSDAEGHAVTHADGGPPPTVPDPTSNEGGGRLRIRLISIASGEGGAGQSPYGILIPWRLR